MLSNKVCLITGSTAGIGKCISKTFLKENCTIIINGRSEKNINLVIEEFKNENLNIKQIISIVADLSTLDGCNKLINEISNTGLFIDILINNMGIFDSGDFFSYDDESWLNYFNTNVMSTVRMCRHFLKKMLESNKGRVIIVSSECGLRPIPNMLPYSMTKGAQLNIARGLAELTKGTNVTVNSLLPGPTATEGLDAFIDGLVAQSNGSTREEAIADYFKIREPTSLIGRFLTPQEVANVALFLASDLSSGINGASQLVEGGIIRHI